MEKHGRYGFDHKHYEVFKTNNGNIFLSEEGILGNENIHIKWDDIFNYLYSIGYKISK